MTNFRESKAQLRRSTVERILAVDRSSRADEERCLLERFIGLPGFREAKTCLFYVSAFAEEIDTRPYLSKCVELSRTLVLPRMNRANRTLSLHQITNPSRDLETGTLGILEPPETAPLVEPSQVDWVLVPGLAFDPLGRRLGRGAGYYDRLLPTLRSDAMKVALILEAQWVEEVPVEPHDFPLDAVISCGKTVFRDHSG